MISPKYVQLLKNLRDERTYNELFALKIYASPSHLYDILSKSIDAGIILKDKKIVRNKTYYSLSIRGRVWTSMAGRLIK